MLDRLSLKLLNKPLHQGALALSRCGISANQVTLCGFAVGLLVIPLLWKHCYLTTLAVILVNRLADGLDGPLARLTQPTESGAFLDIVLDFLFYAAVVFGFGLSNPAENSLAASFLLFSFMGTSASFLAFSIMAERFQLISLRLPNKGFYYLGGLTEGTETIFFFAACCLFPVFFQPVAWFFGSCCFFTACMRILYGYRVCKKHKRFK
jgi:phosphatidylglycerophosphate synthase